MIGITLLFTVDAAGSAQFALILWLTPPFSFLFWLIRRRRSAAAIAAFRKEEPISI
jgi:hypothetical protein